MRSYHYSPSDPDGDDNESMSSNRSASTLENPYDKHWKDREKVDRKKEEAKHFWKKKVKLWSAVLMVTSAFMIYSSIWYANIVGLFAGVIGIYGCIKEHTEFLFVYLVLLFLELLKNIGVFFYFVKPSSENEENTAMLVISVICCIIEEVVVCPVNVYYSFKLYRTLKISSGDDLDEVLSNYR